MKLAKKYSDSVELVECYQEKDLDGILPVVEKARELWRQRCEEYVKQNGDVGTCVCGAGIVVPYLGKHKRYADEKKIISAVSVAGRAQGSCVWEASVKEVIQFLEASGVKGASYDCGYMD